MANFNRTTSHAAEIERLKLCAVRETDELRRVALWAAADLLAAHDDGISLDLLPEAKALVEYLVGEPILRTWVD